MQAQKIKLPGTYLYLIKLKKKLLRAHPKTHDPQIKNLANNIDNRIKKNIKSLNHTKRNSIVGKITSSNPSEAKFWQAINPQNDNETQPLPSLEKSKQEKLEILANHLQNVHSNPHSLGKTQRTSSNTKKPIDSINRFEWMN
jgi:hypothetical protein